MMHLPRLLIAAPASGSGKTTFTCGLLRAFTTRGKLCAAWKCGPDYIDPMFHRESLGIARGGNLDLFLCPEENMTALLCRESTGADIAIIEGVMGYYDGLGGCSDTASSWDVARITKTPVVLLVNAKGISVSIAALISGFVHFRNPSQISAVILNQVSPMMYPTLKTLIEHECKIPVAGYLPPMPDCTFESRHLGLVTADETPALLEKIDRIAAQIFETVDLPLLEKLAQESPALTHSTISIPHLTPVRIAVAQDQAFCFYYRETLSLLQQMGADIVRFSPLTDATLPEADALLIGGGYPELYAKTLSDNRSMRESIANAVRNGMPTIAECGGFLYLQAMLEDTDGTPHPMAGFFSGMGIAVKKLQRFGYQKLTAKQDNLLCLAGQTLPAHEFHYWDTTDNGTHFSAIKPLRDTKWQCVHATETLYAGFPHLYLPGIPDAAVRFLQAAAIYRRNGHGTL